MTASHCSDDSAALPVSARRYLLCIAALAVLLRLGVWCSASDRAAFLRPDSPDYLALADSLAARGVYAKTNEPEIFRTPGYPVLLALVSLVSEPVFGILLLQVLADGVVCALAGVIAWRLTRNRRAVYAAALLHAVSPNAIVYSLAVLSETVFALMLTLFFLALSSGKDDSAPVRRGLLTGLCLAGACLLRGVLLPWIPICVLGLIATTRDGWRRAMLACLLPVVAVVGGWTARNARVAGYPGFSSVAAINLYRYNACALIARRRGASFSRQQAVCDTVMAGYPQAVQAALAMEKALPVILDAPFFYAWIHLRADLDNLLPAAGEFLRLLGIELGGGGTLDVLRSEGILAGVRHYFRGQTQWFWFCVSAVLLLLGKYLLALLGATALLRRRKDADRRAWWLALLLTLTVLYLLLIPGPASHPRFRVPVEPLLAVLAGAGLAAVCLVRKRSPTPQ